MKEAIWSVLDGLSQKQAADLQTMFHSKPWGTGKARFLTSTECVQSLKDKERKKQTEAVQKALHFEERSQKKNQREEELCCKRKKWPERQQKEKQLWWKKKWPRQKEKLLNYK